MIYLYQYQQQPSKEEIQAIIVGILLFVIFLFVRNFWNWIMKRNYRSKYTRLILDFDKQVPTIDKLNLNQTKLLREKRTLERTIEYLKRDKITTENSFKEKEKGLRKKRMQEREAFEKKIDDFKYERIFYKDNLTQTEVKASNTRLSAHFLKNVLFKVQESYKKQDINKVKVLGSLFYVHKENKKELLPIEVLTKINKLLDYNVSTIKDHKVSLNKEVESIKTFLDIIQFLKPNLTITHNFKKNYNLEISPTLFFPFIENTLKHGNLNEKGSFLKIELIIINNILSYRVTNSAFDIKNKEFKKGFGLISLEKALDVYYKNSELEFENIEEEFISELKIEIK